jgi:hypothetical protein
MHIKKNLFLSLLLAVSLMAEENVTSTNIDHYHDTMCQFLVNTSHSIDDYFIEGNTTELSKTRAEFSTSYAIEGHQKDQQDIRLRLRLNLPKIQKNLRLVFEDETNDDALYDGTTLNDQTTLQNKRYYLRLDYFNYVKEKFNMVLGGGVRIRHSNLVPYLNFRSNYDVYQDTKIKSQFYNRFRFYSDGEIENIFEFNSIYTLNPSLYATWRNQLSYERSSRFQTLLNDVTLIQVLDDRKQLQGGVGVVSSFNQFKNANIDYYHLHGLYQHIFYKNWMYYQLAPSILWRETNNFNVSYRFMVNFGILFNND